MTEVAVSVLKTFCSRRSTPELKTSCSRGFGVVALDHAHAAQRFGQPAGDFCVNLSPLAEDGTDGLECLTQADPKHREKAERDGVITALMRMRTTKAITAVRRPPTKSIRPVPTRLRTPSTSHMMRDTIMPVLFES